MNNNIISQTRKLIQILSQPNVAGAGRSLVSHVFGCQPLIMSDRQMDIVFIRNIVLSHYTRLDPTHAFAMHVEQYPCHSFLHTNVIGINIKSIPTSSR